MLVYPRLDEDWEREVSRRGPDVRRIAGDEGRGHGHAGAGRPVCEPVFANAAIDDLGGWEIVVSEVLEAVPLRRQELERPIASRQDDRARRQPARRGAELREALFG